MDPNKRKSSTNDEEHNLKRQRQTDNNKKLEDLNEDVLTEIFLYLNEDELLWVVKASKKFLNSCCRAAEKTYRNNYIELPLSSELAKSYTNKDFNRTFEFVRFFGKNISKMKVNYRQIDSSSRRHLHELIVETCHENLIEIQFNNVSTDMRINKCFAKLQTLRIWYGNIDNSMCQFTKWFPKIENLFISQVHNISTKLIPADQVSSLKHFSLTSIGSNLCNLNQFIQRNPQLMELRLGVYDSHQSGHANDTTMNTNNSVQSATGPAQMMTVKLDNGVPHFLFPKDRIEHLEVPSCDGQISDFIGKCFYLKSLKLNQNVISRYRPMTKLRQLFEGATWMQSAKHELLTYLEINFRLIEDFNPVHAGLLAIVPYLEQCHKLNSVKVTYQSVYESDWIPTVNGTTFIRALYKFKNRINFRQWSFAYEILLEDQEVHFELKKL